MTMVLLPSTTFEQLPQILEDVSPPVTQSSCGRQPSVRHSPGHLLPQPAVLAPRCSCHLWQQLKAKTTQARGKPTGSKPGGLKLQHKSDKNTPVCETASSKEKSTGFQWAEGPKRAQQVFFPSSNFLCFARTSKKITWHLGSREWGNLLQPSCLPGALVGLASKRKSGSIGIILHVSWTLGSPEIRLKWDLSGTLLLCRDSMHGQILASLGRHSEVPAGR